MSSQDHAREMQTYSYRVVDAIFFLRPGTLTILTSSSNFNVRMAIFVQRYKYTQLRYNACVFLVHAEAET